jgi:hypothetical protein
LDMAALFAVVQERCHDESLLIQRMKPVCGVLLRQKSSVFDF